jgi:ketosteroid isomerase-like protein
MPDGTDTNFIDKVFHQFVAAINHHDIGILTALMSSDHLFIDSIGNRVQGKAAMETGWRGYFAMCPDYWIEVENVLAKGETALATGKAGGTIDGIPWNTPAAWKAIVRNGKVIEWRVFADNKPVYEILARQAR